MLLPDYPHCLFVTVHGVPRHQAAFELETRWERPYRGNLIRLLVDESLAQTDLQLICPGTDHMQQLAILGCVIRARQRLAVDGYTAFVQLRIQDL